MSCVAVQIELKVGKNSEPTTVAGAIAGKVREGTRVCLSGVGPESVYNMLFAVAYARQYLKDDAVDLRFLAEFLGEASFSHGSYVPLPVEFMTMLRVCVWLGQR
eukprot:scaffold330_cov396-Prasinococcus_capsulatus_cf.AAC.2